MERVPGQGRHPSPAPDAKTASAYYGTPLLYVVGTPGIQPWEGIGPGKDSFPLPELALSGGGTTSHQSYSNEPKWLFDQMATNMAPINAQPFMLGRRLAHTDFGTGVHSEPENPIFTEKMGKLGAALCRTQLHRLCRGHAAGRGQAAAAISGQGRQRRQGHAPSAARLRASAAGRQRHHSRRQREHQRLDNHRGNLWRRHHVYLAEARVQVHRCCP